MKKHWPADTGGCRGGKLVCCRGLQGTADAGRGASCGHHLLLAEKASAAELPKLEYDLKDPLSILEEPSLLCSSMPVTHAPEKPNRVHGL